MGFHSDMDEGEEDELIQIDGEFVGGGSDLTDAEEAIVSQFLKTDGAQMRNLADIIIEKIRQNSESLPDSVTPDDAIPAKVVEVFTAVGRMLQHYKSGKLPKALKMLPHLKNWEVKYHVITCFKYEC